MTATTISALQPGDATADPATSTPPVTQPETVTVDFAWDDDHCYAAGRLEDLPDTLLALVEDVLPWKEPDPYTAKEAVEQVYNQVKDALDEAAESLEDETQAGTEPASPFSQADLDALEEVHTELGYHCDGCDCAQFAWDDTQTYVAELLSNLDATTWAVASRGYMDDDVTEIDLDPLLRDQRQWDSLRVSITGADVDVDVHGSSYQIRALKPTEQALYERWGDTEYSVPDTAASLIHLHGEDAIELALDIVAETDDDEPAAFEYDVCTIAGALTRLDPALREQLEPSVVVALARTWTGTLEDLLTVAVAITT